MDKWVCVCKFDSNLIVVCVGNVFGNIVLFLLIVIFVWLLLEVGVGNFMYMYMIEYYIVCEILV